MSERSTFESDKEISLKLLMLKAVADDLERGNVLTWESAEQAMQMDRNEPRFRYIINKWRRDLHRDKQIETWAELSVGIRLLTQQEQVTFLPQKRAKRASRQHRMILRSIKNTDFAQLTEREVLMAKAIESHSKQARQQARKVTQSANCNVTSDRAILLERALKAEMKRAAETAISEAH